MAKKSKSKASNNKLPKGMKVVTRSGGKTKDLESEFKSAGGPILFPKKGDSFTVAILQTPIQWTRYEEHSIQRKKEFKYVPCAGPDVCLVDKRIPDNEARTYAMIPMYIYDLKAVKVFRAPGGAVNELVKTYKRIKDKGFLGKKFIFERNDDTDFTQYEFERLDISVKRKVRELEVPDVDEIIQNRLQRSLNDLGWLNKRSISDDDDDEDEYEDIDDEEDEDDDDLEDIDDDEDEDEDEEEDEEEDDNDVEDEDEDDDEDELPPKRAKKSKKKVRSKR